MATNTEKLDNIAINVAQLTTLFTESCKKVDGMHKVLITGNGQKPLVETVRNHDAWIAEQEEKKKEEDKKTEEKKKEEDRRKWETKKTYIGLSVGWILTLIGLGVAIFT